MCTDADLWGIRMVTHPDLPNTQNKTGDFDGVSSRGRGHLIITRR